MRSENVRNVSLMNTLTCKEKNSISENKYTIPYPRHFNKHIEKYFNSQIK